MSKRPNQPNPQNTLKQAIDNISSKFAQESTTFNEASKRLAKKEESKWPDLDQLEYESKFLENQRYKHDTHHRNTLSTWASVVVSFWLLSVLLILVGNTNSYKLSDSVLIALLGTTTINVLGLMVIVLSDLFNKNKTTNNHS